MLIVISHYRLHCVMGEMTNAENTTVKQLGPFGHL